MEKIKISHTPKFMNIVMGVLMFIALGIALSVKAGAKMDKGETIIALIITLLFLVMLGLVIGHKTTVIFGEGSIIRCRWLFAYWKIDLEDTETVTYTLRSHMTRGGGRAYHFEMMFYPNAKDAANRKVLREFLNADIAEDCIRQKYDGVNLMRLYGYIEENYPDKARGFIKMPE